MRALVICVILATLYCGAASKRKNGGAKANRRGPEISLDDVNYVEKRSVYSSQKDEAKDMPAKDLEYMADYHSYDRKYGYSSRDIVDSAYSKQQETSKDYSSESGRTSEDAKYIRKYLENSDSEPSEDGVYGDSSKNEPWDYDRGTKNPRHEHLRKETKRGFENYPTEVKYKSSRKLVDSSKYVPYGKSSSKGDAHYRQKSELYDLTESSEESCMKPSCSKKNVRPYKIDSKSKTRNLDKYEQKLKSADKKIKPSSSSSYSSEESSDGNAYEDKSYKYTSSHFTPKNEELKETPRRDKSANKKRNSHKHASHIKN